MIYISEFNFFQISSSFVDSNRKQNQAEENILFKPHTKVEH